MTGRRPPRRSLAAIFAMPLLVAAASVAGLVAGLEGDAQWRVAAWIGLGLPAVLALRCMADRSTELDRDIGSGISANPLGQTDD